MTRVVRPPSAVVGDKTSVTHRRRSWELRAPKWAVVGDAKLLDRSPTDLGITNYSFPCPRGLLLARVLGCWLLSAAQHAGNKSSHAAVLTRTHHLERIQDGDEVPVELGVQ